MEIIKKMWKPILASLVLLGVSGILISYVVADDTPVLSVSNVSEQFNIESGVDVTLTATVSSLKISTDMPASLYENNLLWYTDNYQTVAYVKPNGIDTFAASDIVKGQTITVRSLMAGVAYLTARYYYYPDDHSKELDSALTQSDIDSLVASELLMYEEFTLTPFNVLLNVNFANFTYQEDPIMVFDGNSITVRSDNIYSNDPMVIDCSNDVFTVDTTNYNTSVINLVKGGVGTVYVRPSTGRDSTSGLLIEGLYRSYTFYNKVNFDNSYLNSVTGRKEAEVSGSAFGSTPIDSNISIQASAQVSYESTNDTIVTMDKSVLVPGNAGYATVTAGIKDANGNFISYLGNEGVVESWDELDVHVPLVWNCESPISDSLTINMNAADTYQLKTNAGDKNITYVSQDPTIARVTDTGLVTAMTYGTTVITAHVTGSDEINGTPVLFDETIEVTINVVDNFSLSTSSHSIQVGESFEITAITSSDDAVVEFYIDGVEANSASGGLVGLVEADNKKVLIVTGVNEGTYQVEARQIVNGMTKKLYCTIEVKTPVTTVTIAPETLKMNAGETATLRVTVNPATAFNKNVVWVSSDPEVVSIDTDSASEYEVVVTANKGGIATVTVVSAADGTKYATCSITVREAVTGITLNETNVTISNMNVIREYVLLATVEPVNTTGLEDGVNRNVIWSSTDESVLTVDNNGKVTFVSPGYAAVIAKTEDGGFTASCNFTIGLPVEEVRITSEDLILNVGEEIALSAEVLPLTATNRTIEWSTTDENVCVIDSNGTLKAVNAGHCAVFARSLDNGAEDYINVYVRQPVSTIKMNVNETTVTKGTVFWLYATILPEDADIKEVIWSSSDETLATVGTDGMVTALMPGVVTITATSKDTGDADYCRVLILDPVTSITLVTGDSQTLFVGSQFTIVPEILPIDAPNKSVTYLSSNESIATVDENGVVTAIMGGECDIIVTTVERELKAICHITVIEYLSTITLDKSFTYLNIGSYIDLVATTTTDTATNKNITWKTSNSGIATVNESGRVTAVAYGTVVITAEAEDGGGATATCIVQVIEPVTKVTVSPTELKLLAGDTYLLTSSVAPANASVQKLQWHSTNTSVATVDEDGEITAVAGGKCRIVATSTDGNGVSAYCTLYVTNKTNATKLTINSSNITIKIGEIRQLTVKSMPENITEELCWYSTDTGVVTVDQNGTITGIDEGVANIVVYGKSSGVEGVCQVTVKSNTIKATSIKLNSDEITMLSGKTRLLTVRLNPVNSNEVLRWHSTDTSVVVVDSNGKITTVGPGHAEVVVVTETTGLESVCVVHSIAISRSSVTLQQYDPFKLYVDGAASGVSWRTNNPRIATVSSTGEVIGRKPGTTTITATVDNKTLTCTVTITEATKY